MTPGAVGLLLDPQNVPVPAEQFVFWKEEGVLNIVTMQTSGQKQSFAFVTKTFRELFLQYATMTAGGP